MYVGMHMGGAVQHLTHFSLEVRTEEVEEEGGRQRERRGRQALGFLSWAQLVFLHSEAESGKLIYNSSHKGSLLATPSSGVPCPVSANELGPSPLTPGSLSLGS